MLIRNALQGEHQGIKYYKKTQVLVAVIDTNRLICFIQVSLQ